jgi:uncharacterized damage-inducible protein DinB
VNLSSPAVTLIISTRHSNQEIKPMKSMTVEQAEFLLHDILLATLKNEHRTTRAVIEAVPLDKGEYRPDDIAMTAIGLSWHIIVAEMRFMDTVLTGAFDTTPRPRPENIKTSADVAQFYGQEFQKNFDKLMQARGASLIKNVDFRGLFQFPAVVFLQVGMNHSIHHRGQLSTYLRPMGAKVPSIYGESYDAAQARKAVGG